MNNQFENPLQEQEISLKDYYRILLQYKWLIIVIFVLVFTTTAIYTAMVPRIYKASCRILIEENNSNNMFFSANNLSNTSINNTIEILKSRPVMEIAVQILKKNNNYSTFPISVSLNPEGAVLGRITVENKRETNILTISCESTNPLEAQAVADAAAEALMRQNTSYARMELTNIRDFLEKNLDSITRRLRNSEEELRRYKLDHGITELSSETTKMIDNSTRVESMIEDANTEMQIATERLEFLNNELSKQDSLILNVNSILTSPLLDQLRTNVVSSQSRLAKLLTKQDYDPNHPELRELTQEIENAKQKLNEEIQRIVAVRVGSSDPLVYRADLIQQIASIQIDLNVAETKYSSLLDVRENYDTKMSLLPDTELELARKTRTYTMNEKVYSLLIEKYEDAKISEQAKMGNIRLVESASLPRNPIKPKKTMNLLVGLVLGFGAGVGLAFVLHSLDTKLRTLDDVDNYVNLPVAGTIPFINVKDSDLDEVAKEIGTAKGKEKDELIYSHRMMMSRLITHYAPKSPVAESYRTLRTNLLAKHPNKKCITMLVTSSGPKEGKSTTISNLAIALSQMDAKVCLIDLDMRRPMLHTLFNVEKNYGASDFLIDENTDLDSVIYPTSVENLDLITSGYIPPNPSELISSKRLDLFLSKLQEKYDYILIDSPPVIAVTDALILAKKVDLMTLVIRVGITDRDIIRRAKEILGNVHANIAGVIVNGIEAKKYYSGYGNYYYYYYYYYHEGEDGKVEKRKR
jgi:tyrosine-protein kinase Etk/Wzc